MSVICTMWGEEDGGLPAFFVFLSWSLTPLGFIGAQLLAFNAGSSIVLEKEHNWLHSDHHGCTGLAWKQILEEWSALWHKLCPVLEWRPGACISQGAQSVDGHKERRMDGRKEGEKRRKR